VNEVSRTNGGRAIRWLGDGGLLFFEDVGAAFHAALELSERAQALGLPPTHIGVQAGPVVFRDDVYGRTVNIASRIADEAEAGEVLTSQETTEETEDGFIRFERSRTTHLKGVANPITLYRAVRGS
jgi:adenylate cyclase